MTTKTLGYIRPAPCPECHGAPVRRDRCQACGCSGTLAGFAQVEKCRAADDIVRDWRGEMATEPCPGCGSHAGTEHGRVCPVIQARLAENPTPMTWPQEYPAAPPRLRTAGEWGCLSNMRGDSVPLIWSHMRHIAAARAYRDGHWLAWPTAGLDSEIEGTAPCGTLPGAQRAALTALAAAGVDVDPGAWPDGGKAAVGAWGRDEDRDDVWIRPNGTSTVWFGVRQWGAEATDERGGEDLGSFPTPEHAMAACDEWLAARGVTLPWDSLVVSAADRGVLADVKCRVYIGGFRVPMKAHPTVDRLWRASMGQPDGDRRAHFTRILIAAGATVEGCDE